MLEFLCCCLILIFQDFGSGIRGTVALRVCVALWNGSSYHRPTAGMISVEGEQGPHCLTSISIIFFLRLRVRAPHPVGVCLGAHAGARRLFRIQKTVRVGGSHRPTFEYLGYGPSLVVSTHGSCIFDVRTRSWSVQAGS